MSIKIGRVVLSTEQEQILKQALILYIGKTTERGLTNEVFYNPSKKSESDALRNRLLMLYLAIDGQVFRTNHAMLATEGLPNPIVMWFERLITPVEVKYVITSLELVIDRIQKHPELPDNPMEDSVVEVLGIFSPIVELAYA